MTPIYRPERIPVTSLLWKGLKLTECLDFNCQASLFLAPAGMKPQSENYAAISHDIRHTFSLSSGTKWSMKNEFFHSLGFQYFFDSVNRISLDETKLTLAADMLLPGRVSFRIIAGLQSGLLPEYLYQPNDSGTLVRILTKSFLTPLLVNIQPGMAWSWPGVGDISLALTGLKITWVMDDRVFRSGLDQFCGVPAGKQWRVEYGIAIKARFSYQLMRLFSWSLDMNGFKNFKDPWDVELKNLIEVKPARFFKICLKTRLFYESDMYRKIQVENSLSAGFCYTR